jgi:hypothetical protein
MNTQVGAIPSKKIERAGVRRVSEPTGSPQSLDNSDDDRSIESDDDSDDEHGNQISTERKDKSSRKRIIIDETKLDRDELRKLENRREYNRKCAARARKRSKDLVSTLQKQVDELTSDKAELKRTNDVMKAQLELLEQQNRTLLMSQMAGQLSGGPSLQARVALGLNGNMMGNSLNNNGALSGSMRGLPGFTGMPSSLYRGAGGNGLSGFDWNRLR